MILQIGNCEPVNTIQSSILQKWGSVGWSPSDRVESRSRVVIVSQGSAFAEVRALRAPLPMMRQWETFSEVPAQDRVLVASPYSVPSAGFSMTSVVACCPPINRDTKDRQQSYSKWFSSSVKKFRILACWRSNSSFTSASAFIARNCKSPAPQY